MQKSIIRIGTSGFCYKDWLGNFYPQFCPEADFLRFYASRFKTVEIDSTFYKMPTAETVKKWCCSTPENFVFTAKFPKEITCQGCPGDSVEQAKAFIKMMNKCGSKLGPLLIQIPVHFKPDRFEALARLLNALPDNTKYALEIRDKCWLEVDRLFEILKEKNIAFSMIDHPWMPKVSIQTADFVYFRFLGDRKAVERDFSFVRYERDEDLAFWTEAIKKYSHQDIPCYGYVNNHYSGHAPSTAQKLVELIS